MALPYYSAIGPVVIPKSRITGVMIFRSEIVAAKISSQDWLKQEALHCTRHNEYIHGQQPSQGGSFFLTDFSAPFLRAAIAANIKTFVLSFRRVST